MTAKSRRGPTGAKPPPRNSAAAALRHFRPTATRNKKLYTRKGRSRPNPQDRPFSLRLPAGGIGCDGAAQTPRDRPV